ncbi:TIGR03086 family metal-binding protein [Streptomyces sp. XM4193]|uniref:TIGR03086 family metal-binding protein n=1 Tax=Streptomyces sp. XM4193 TaxID=2929782 RepID=UPI001FF97BF3|nr:TIGR03086 family metal-binding protein [Streptomyces sp. XM4193]MCK1795326.1 TIGR03086 family metal-binding protein [Streptomyces sp. XM4193]
MDLLTALDRGFTEFGQRVEYIGDDQWSADTPCTEWSVRDLVNHLIGEHLWAPWLLKGASVAEVGDRFDGDVGGDDPRGAWEAASAVSQPAFHRPGALELRVDTTMGPLDAEEYGWQMTIDLTVHAWDLARGIGVVDRLDPELAGALLERVAPQAEEWQGHGIFAPPVKVPADAPAQDQLVALLGRTP